MTDKGLNHRLRQRSRRAGLMIGVSMALTIAVCIGGFSVIYAGVDGIVGDFVSRDAPTDTPLASQGEAQIPADSLTETSDVAETQPTTALAPTATVAPEETPAADAFAPDYQTSGDFTLRLRSEPSTTGGESTIVEVLPPGTPLQYLDEDQPSDNPGTDGDRWMRFQIEDGTEGWLREIDVVTFEP